MEGLDELMPLVKRAAKAVAFQWPGVIERDDAQQEICLALLKRPKTIKKIAGMDYQAGYRAVVGIGHQIASEERTKYDYYKGSYFYSVKEVKDLLAREILVYRDKFRSEWVDMELALQEIAPQYHEAITRRYIDKLIPETQRQKDAQKRGLVSLTNKMNAVHRRLFVERDDGPGTRKAISNAQAYAISAHQYDGDHDYDDLSDFSSGGFR